jgi:hypothetical protein
MSRNQPMPNPATPSPATDFPVSPEMTAKVEAVIKRSVIAGDSLAGPEEYDAADAALDSLLRSIGELEADRIQLENRLCTFRDAAFVGAPEHIAAEIEELDKYLASRFARARSHKEESE